MNDKLKSFLKKFLDIFLTALVSAIIAFLSEWLKAKTGTSGVQIDVKETAGIGGVLSAFKNIKNIKFFG